MMTKLDAFQQQIAKRVNDGTDADPLKAALAYASHGYRVVPLYVRDGAGSCSCFLGKRCFVAAGHPCVTDSTNAAETIIQWWSEWPTAGVGLVTGSSSGFVSLQFGHASDGTDTVAAFEADYGTLPITARRRMAEGGTQYFLRIGDGVVITGLLQNAKSTPIGR